MVAVALRANQEMVIRLTGDAAVEERPGAISRQKLSVRVFECHGPINKHVVIVASLSFSFSLQPPHSFNESSFWFCSLLYLYFCVE